MADHPCRSCGACCAFFRVEFYWREANAEDAPNSVPVELTQDVNHQTRCMKGTTDNRRIRCVALEGKIGQEVNCGIYERRSSPCRRFEASYENGRPNYRCDEARAHYGLLPLTRKDFSPLAEAAVARVPQGARDAGAASTHKRVTSAVPLPKLN